MNVKPKDTQLNYISDYIYAVATHSSTHEAVLWWSIIPIHCTAYYILFVVELNFSDDSFGVKHDRHHTHVKSEEWKARTGKGSRRFE